MLGIRMPKILAISFCNLTPKEMHMLLIIINSIIFLKQISIFFNYILIKIGFLFYSSNKFDTRFTQNYFFCSFVFISEKTIPATAIFLFCKASIVNRV
jgi:hypothetical protein